MAQQFRYVIPHLQVTTNAGAVTQTRSLAGQYNGYCQQGSQEILDRAGFAGSGRRVAYEALQLLDAPNCPSGGARRGSRQHQRQRPLARGFGSSFGSRRWHETHSFNVDFSLYLAGDKAVKSRYAGFDWNSAALRAIVDTARDQLAVLGRPARTLCPGKYRAYLAPAAMVEIVGLMAWSGFGQGAAYPAKPAVAAATAQ